MPHLPFLFIVTTLFSLASFIKALWCGHISTIHHPAFSRLFCLPSHIWKSCHLEYHKYPSKFIVTNILAPNTLFWALCSHLQKWHFFIFFFIKSISKSKMDILILSILEILKKVMKKICNMHIVTATYFIILLDHLNEDKKYATCILWLQRIFIVFWIYQQTIKGLVNLLYYMKGFFSAYMDAICVGTQQQNLIYYFIYNSKTIRK